MTKPLIIALIILTFFGCKEDKGEIKTEAKQEIKINLTLEAPTPQGIEQPEFTPNELKLELKTNLFILSGQSNMVNFREDLFAIHIMSALPLDRNIIAKSAKGNMPIRHWYRLWQDQYGVIPADNGILYDELLKAVDTALNGIKPDTITFLWIQGESDGEFPVSVDYGLFMEGLVDQLRQDLNRDDINIILSKIADFTHYQYPYWQTVREQQEIVTARNGWPLIDTDDLDTVDGVHYTVEGYKILAQRFATEAVKLTSNPK